MSRKNIGIRGRRDSGRNAYAKSAPVKDFLTTQEYDIDSTIILVMLPICSHELLYEISVLTT